MANSAAAWPCWVTCFMWATASSAPEGRLAYLRRVHGEHEYIFNAIRNQDADAARAAMRTHLANSKDRLRKSQTDAV